MMNKARSFQGQILECQAKEFVQAEGPVGGFFE